MLKAFVNMLVKFLDGGKTAFENREKKYGFKS